MPTRITFLFDQTTEPTDRVRASPHSGGWSESWWTSIAGGFTKSTNDLLMSKRALLLPEAASIIGLRVSDYNLVGNTLVPAGSSTQSNRFPGVIGEPCDLPQVALELSGRAAGFPNGNHLALRGIPDGVMVNGEYQPDGTFRASMAEYLRVVLINGIGFVGRDLAQPRHAVISIGGGLVRVGPGAGFNEDDYVIFNSVRDDAGKTVKGRYLVTAPVAPPGNSYAVQGLQGRTVSVANGTVRKDIAKFFQYGSLVVSRAVVRKVGRPFESYRGRQSRRRGS